MYKDAKYTKHFAICMYIMVAVTFFCYLSVILFSAVPAWLGDYHDEWKGYYGEGIRFHIMKYLSILLVKLCFPIHLIYRRYLYHVKPSNENKKYYIKLLNSFKRIRLFEDTMEGTGQLLITLWFVKAFQPSDLSIRKRNIDEILADISSGFEYFLDENIDTDSEDQVFLAYQVFLARLLTCLCCSSVTHTILRMADAEPTESLSLLPLLKKSFTFLLLIVKNVVSVFARATAILCLLSSKSFPASVVLMLTFHLMAVLIILIVFQRSGNNRVRIIYTYQKWFREKIISS